MKKTEEEGFLNSRDAARYVGYNPQPAIAADGTRNNAASDSQMRAFYAWVDSHQVPKHRRGRCLLFKREDLDRAIGRCTDAHHTQHLSRLEQMAELGRRLARGESPCVN